jgi:hypothetical protein
VTHRSTGQRSFHALGHERLADEEVEVVVAAGLVLQPLADVVELGHGRLAGAAMGILRQRLVGAVNGVDVGVGVANGVGNEALVLAVVLAVTMVAVLVVLAAEGAGTSAGSRAQGREHRTRAIGDHCGSEPRV